MFLDLLPIIINELAISIVIIFVVYVIKSLLGFGSEFSGYSPACLFLPLPIIVPVLALLTYSSTMYQSFTYYSDVVRQDV